MLTFSCRDMKVVALFNGESTPEHLFVFDESPEHETFEVQFDIDGLEPIVSFASSCILSSSSFSLTVL